MKAKSHERDPRVDPRPGDVLLVGSTYRDVRTYKRGVSFWQRVGGRQWTLEKAKLDDWQAWAKHAEVLNVAE